MLLVIFAAISKKMGFLNLVPLIIVSCTISVFHIRYACKKFAITVAIS